MATFAHFAVRVLPILAAQEQKRVELCRRAIEEALRRHGCVLLPEVTICGGRVSAIVRIVAGNGAMRQ